MMPIPKGFKFTNDSKIKMRNSRLGFKASEETKKKISLLHKGKIVRPESIEKMRKTKLSNPNRFGRFASNWKGGKTRLSQLIRSSFLYRQWRSDVFQRDNYTCVECGSPSNGDIEVHHIKQMALIIAERKVDSIESALLCSELWNINNGVTLCIDCHKKTDTYRNNKIICASA